MLKLSQIYLQEHVAIATALLPATKHRREMYLELSMIFRNYIKV
jgi:hypothetical protein